MPRSSCGVWRCSEADGCNCGRNAHVIGSDQRRDNDGGEWPRGKLMTLHRISSIAFASVLGVCVAAPSGAQQRVSVYTAHTANFVEQLIPDFEKATGIKADVV